MGGIFLFSSSFLSNSVNPVEETEVVSPERQQDPDLAGGRSLQPSVIMLQNIDTLRHRNIMFSDTVSMLKNTVNFKLIV